MTGADLKKRGIKRAVDAHALELHLARGIAEALGARGNVVTADMVRVLFESTHLNLSWLSGWSGHIFRDRTRWEFSGYEESSVPSRHAGIQRKWRWIGNRNSGGNDGK